MKIAAEAADHLDLLPVLLAEIGQSGPDLAEEFRDDGGDAPKWPGLAAPSHRSAGPAISIVVTASGGYIVPAAEARRVAAGRLEGGEVAFSSRGYRAKSSARAELQGIDENRGGHHGRGFARGGEQGEVAGVQRAHGRNEGQRAPVAGKAGAMGGQLFEASCDQHGGEATLRRGSGRGGGQGRHVALRNNCVDRI